MLFEQCANMARCDNDSNDYLILLWKIYRASLPISLSLQYAGSSQISGDNDYLFLRQFPDIIWARISAFFGEAKKCRLRGPNYIGETDAGNMSFYS